MTKFLASENSFEFKQFRHLHYGEQWPSSLKQEQCNLKQFEFVHLQLEPVFFIFLFLYFWVFLGYFFFEKNYLSFPNRGVDKSGKIGKESATSISKRLFFSEKNFNYSFLGPSKTSNF